ncbi:hypothetical protein, partial [Muricomes intestini]|uniref:hypothetical protein n=1 Tax=Muricomes intestini TaxID=1796634 RepID=UPI002FE28788
GMNPSTGNYRAGGEAGDEVVAGKNTLLNLIREVVSTENNRNTDDIVDAIMNGMANLALQIDVYLGGRKIYDKLTKGVIKKVTREQDDKFGAKGVHA